MGIITDVKYDSGSDHEVTSQHLNVLRQVAIIAVAKMKINTGLLYVNLEISQQVELVKWYTGIPSHSTKRKEDRSRHLENGGLR